MEGRTQFYDPDLLAHLDPVSHVSESVKIIRTNIEFSSIDKPLKTIAVTSTSQSEGKTSIIANLAITYAQVGRRVLLIDSDLRRPMVHRLFGVSNRRGLTNVLVSGREYKEFVQETLTENLYVLTSGPIPPNPAEILMTTAFGNFIETVRQDFDMVFFDAPPIAVVTDAAIISTKVDGIVYIVKSGDVDRKQLQHASALLKQVKANVIGYILNGVKEDSENYYYYYSSHYRYAAPPNDDQKKGKKKGKKTQPDNPFYLNRKPARRRQPPPQLRAPVLPELLTEEEKANKIESINRGIASEDD
jgi:capsular exopolysaccharide synthesis family protein